MNLDHIVASLNITVVALVLAASMLVAWKVGRIGGRLRAGENGKLSKFDDASVAVLSLLLGFSFGMSIAKHDQRRLAVVKDANAIEDFYTCASLLKEPTRSKLQALIQQYVQLRLELARSPHRSADLERAVAKSQRMHSEMTELVAQALKDGTPISVPLTNTLNEVTSSQTSRLAAYGDRLPSSIVLLLYVSAIIVMLLIGRQQGIDGSTDIAGTLCFVLLVSTVVYVTLDLNRPERGLISVSQEPIERLVFSITK